jgi:tRNA uridine 5-carboxymethylaminomethyl modification enzyme
MFTSRAEYRVLLRHDNADRRLTPLAFKRGLVGEDRWRRLDDKIAQIDSIRGLLDATSIQGVPLSKHLRRPDSSWPEAVARLPLLAEADAQVVQQVLCDLKYAGYVVRQQTEIERQQRLAEKRIPEAFSYDAIVHLRAEAREKLARIRPRNLSQASRISGITPADVALLMVQLDGKSTVKKRPLTDELHGH